MRRYNLNSYFDFGKYRNQKIEYVVLNDINYIIWCIKEIEDLIFHKDVIELVIENKNKIFADTNDSIKFNLSNGLEMVLVNYIIFFINKAV